MKLSKAKGRVKKNKRTLKNLRKTFRHKIKNLKRKSHKKYKGGVGDEPSRQPFLTPLKQATLAKLYDKYNVPPELTRIIGEHLVDDLTNENIRDAVNMWQDNQEECLKKYGHISQWNTSAVTDMSELFYTKDSSFNENINNWDVSNVTDMYGMFAGASSFNQPLEEWNVAKVTDMSNMFRRASSFNQPLEKWNVANVTNMSGMFAGASKFNQPLEEWNVANVTTM